VAQALYSDPEMMKARALLYLSLFLFSVSAFGGEAPCRSCGVHTGGVVKEVEQAAGAVKGFLYSIYGDSLAGCPWTGSKNFSSSQNGLSVTFKRSWVSGPVDCRSAADGPPDSDSTSSAPCPSFVSGAAASWKLGSAEVKGGRARTLCQIDLNQGCGDPQVSRLEKLEWMASHFRHVGTALCREATEHFYKACGRWNDKNDQQRRDAVFAEAAEAIQSYTPEPGKMLYPSPREPRRRSVPPLVKSDFLTPELTQCLLHREDPDFTPNRLNPTECMRRLNPAKKSSAAGLVMVTRSTANLFWKSNLLQGHRNEFKSFWQSVAPGQPCTEASDGETFFRQMSDNPELQIVAGLKVLNYVLQYSEEELRARGERPAGSAPKNARGYTEKQVVENGLKMWFGAGECAPSLVWQCEDCILKKKQPLEKCLDLTGGRSCNL